MVKHVEDKEQELIVEVQAINVFNNLNLYLQAKEKLKNINYKLLLDSISPTALKMLNIHNLSPDLIKLFWEPLLEYSQKDSDLEKEINFIGKENIILAKCDSEKSLKWGLKYGISSFQGPYVDVIETTLSKVKCPHSKECSTQQCLKRRRVIGGNLREECFDNKFLDELL